MPDEPRYAPAMISRNLDQPETASLLPELKTEYQAAAMAGKDCVRLTLVMGKEGFAVGKDAYISIQYVHLGTGKFGFSPKGQAFTFLISDYQPKLLTVEGRNLLLIYEYISLHRMPWIRLIDRDLRPIDDVSQEPVITAIRFEDWTPQRDGI